MRITLLSDLHLEGQSLSELSGGDVLLLAGDTCEVGNLPRYTSFIEEIAEKFRNVYVIAGNHEFYGSSLEDTIKIMRDIYKPWKNIQVLDNEAPEIASDLVVFGATMWTDFNKEDYGSMQECKHSMNDYGLIRKGNGFLEPNDVLSKHYESLHSLKFCVEAYPTKKFIVMTHHAPSQKSIHPRFTDYGPLNGGFCNDLDQFIWDHPNIKFWVHGHCHNSFDYKVGTCQIYCNPRGTGKKINFSLRKIFLLKFKYHKYLV